MTRTEFLAGYGIDPDALVAPHMVRMRGRSVEHDFHIDPRGGPLWSGLRLKAVSLHIDPSYEYVLRFFIWRTCRIGGLAALCPYDLVLLHELGSLVPAQIPIDLALFNSGRVVPLDVGNDEPVVMRLSALSFAPTTEVTLVLGVYGAPTYAGEVDLCPDLPIVLPERLTLK